ncbi:UNVERIFIED_CONTAM: hypothetical protein Sindi_1834700, partial [Sesamum indicum]
MPTTTLTTVQQLECALDGGYEINYQGLGLKYFKSTTSRLGIESPTETCIKNAGHICDLSGSIGK